jgi:PPM family protein phosphatase
MPENQPAPVENLAQPEAEVKAVVTPGIAHVALIGVESSFANPSTNSVTNEQKEAWIGQTPDVLKAGIDAANEVSWESRDAAYENDTRAFDEKNKEWNNEFWDAVQESMNDTTLPPSVRGARRLAYESVGIEVASSVVVDGMYPQVEAFRQKYVPENGSDINQFIADLSSGCKNADGTVNMDTLQERLDAIAPMLSVFGTEKSADELVSDFAMAQAMLAQDADTKEDLANRISFHIGRPVSSPEEARLHALSEKLNAPPETEQTVEQPSPSEAKHLARGLLGRELTDQENAMLDQGHNVRDVLREARRNTPIAQMNRAVPLTVAEYQDPNTDMAKRARAMIEVATPADIKSVLQHYNMDPASVQATISMVEKQADAIRQMGGEPGFIVHALKNPSTGEKTPIPEVITAEYPEGVDIDQFERQLHQKFTELVQQREENPTSSEEEAAFGEVAAAKTIKNEKGSSHQDRLLFSPNERAFAVFDGVGGGADGDKAAQLAKDFFTEGVKHIPDGLSAEETAKFLQRMAIECNDVIYKNTNGDTTLTFNYIHEDADGKKKLININVGDSRVYRLRNGKLEGISLDDPDPSKDPAEQWAHQKLLASIDTKEDFKALSKREKIAYQNRNVISSALGTSIIEPSINIVDVEDDDTFLLTTDGIHDNLTDAQIESILQENLPPAETVAKLINAALDRSRIAGDVRGKKDDITALVVRGKNLPDKPAAKALTDVEDPENPFSKNVTTFERNLQLVKDAQEQVGRDLTPVEQFYVIQGNDIRFIDKVDPVYQSFKRARANRLYKERYDHLQTRKGELQSSGQTDTDEYRAIVAEFNRASINFDTQDGLEAFMAIRNISPDKREEFRKYLRERDGEKPENTKTILTVMYRKDEDEVTQEYLTHQYVPTT